MTTKERLLSELDGLSEGDLAELLALAQARRQSASGHPPGLLSKLRRIRIDAPADFAASLDDYASGEKRLGE